MSKHRTAKGREFNMAQFATDRGDTVAVGNSGRNARGDLLGAGGKVIATRQQITNQAHNRSVVQQKQVKLNPLEQETSRKEVVAADGNTYWEVTFGDGSVEMQLKEKAPETKKKAKSSDAEETTYTTDDFTNGE